jgi:hypothetical protein
MWDDEVMPATLGIRRMFDEWRSSAELAAESQQVFENYDGGDILDVGAFQGWYPLLLAKKARPGRDFRRVRA